jgi:hypothetical protein
MIIPMLSLFSLFTNVFRRETLLFVTLLVVDVVLLRFRSSLKKIHVIF